MDGGAQLGVKMNHKVKLHGVRKNTQDQPGVEDGKQKHHTGLPGVRKSGKMQAERIKRRRKKKPIGQEPPGGISKGEVLQKSPNTPPCPLAGPVRIPKCPNKTVQK